MPAGRSGLGTPVTAAPAAPPAHRRKGANTGVHAAFDPAAQCVINQRCTGWSRHRGSLLGTGAASGTAQVRVAERLVGCVLRSTAVVGGGVPLSSQRLRAFQRASGCGRESGMKPPPCNLGVGSVMGWAGRRAEWAVEPRAQRPPWAPSPHDACACRARGACLAEVFGTGRSCPDDCEDLRHGAGAGGGVVGWARFAVESAPGRWGPSMIAAPACLPRSFWPCCGAWNAAALMIARCRQPAWAAAVASKAPNAAAVEPKPAKASGSRRR